MEWYRGPFIRKLSRRDDWQLRYAISLELKQPLFEGELASFDINRMRFLYWLNFYHHIYSKPDKERPKEEIINDDVLLDEYMRQKIARDKMPPTRIRRSKKGSKGGTDVINFNN